MGSDKRDRADRGRTKRSGDLPRVRKSSKDKVIAILCSDIHLSHKPPIARSAEPDWYAAQARALNELEMLRMAYAVPVICAGDIFDRWNPPCELINFAIEYLPPMYAVPGQHDLPLHNYSDIKKSGYWTLCKANKVINLRPRQGMYDGEGLCIWGFPWGTEVKPIKLPDQNFFHIAVVHAYIWTAVEDTGFPGAPAEALTTAWRKRLKGFDVAVFGDNHKGLEAGNIFNSGTFMRRKSDEKDYKPQVGLLKENGTIVPHYLDCSEDKFLEVEDYEQILKNDGDMRRFVQELSGLGHEGLDFVEAVKQFFQKHPVAKAVRRAILEAIEEHT